MRLALLAAIVAAVIVTPLPAQESVGTSQQAQTSAARIDIARPQPPTCGAAPSVAQINRLAQAIRRVLPRSAGFDAGFRAEAMRPCQRNRVAAYLVRTIAASNWTFAPLPGLRASYLPSNAFACGPAATGADLNVLITRLRPLFADPGPFNASIAAFARQQCTDSRATLYLVALIADNGLSLR